MAVDHIRYDLLTQEALRGVLRTVLEDAAKNGLPGEHHFYISFDSRADGVRLSGRMRAQYPEEMTIVLQHQFWDLVVTEHAFEVGLSFGGVPERLTVPFAAIKRFTDPSVQFGLQFEQIPAADAASATPKGEPSSEKDIAPPARPPAEHRHGRTAPADVAAPAPANPLPEDPKPEGGAEVVSLDRFRKK